MTRYVRVCVLGLSCGSANLHHKTSRGTTTTNLTYYYTTRRQLITWHPRKDRGVGCLPVPRLQRPKGHFTHTSQKLWPSKIVRAQKEKKVSQGRPQRTSKVMQVLWSRSLKCSVKSYVTGPLTKCYFGGFLSMLVLMCDKVE